MTLLFRLGSCQIQLGFSCFLLLAFSCLFLGTENGVVFLAAAVCHETAHLLVLLGLRAPPSWIRLTGLGCRIVPNKTRMLSYGQSALVSLAGPGCNLLLAGGMLLIGKTDLPFFSANLILGALHALPIEPLDGGLALHGLLCAWKGERRGGKLSLAVSLLCLLPLATLGFWILLYTRYNFTLLAMSLYLMLYLVLKRDYLIG
mgnify:FL=1